MIRLLLPLVVLFFSNSLSAQSMMGLGVRANQCGVTESDFHAIDAASPCVNYSAHLPREMEVSILGGAPTTIRPTLSGNDPRQRTLNHAAFADMVGDQIGEMQCRQNLLEQARSNISAGNSQGEPSTLARAAIDSFKAIREQISGDIRESAETRASQTRNLGFRDSDDGIRRIAQNQHEERIDEITKAFSGVPFGTETKVLNVLREFREDPRFQGNFDDNSELRDEFIRRYEYALFETATTYSQAADELTQLREPTYATNPSTGNSVETGSSIRFDMNTFQNFIRYGVHDDLIGKLVSAENPISLEAAGRFECQMLAQIGLERSDVQRNPYTEGETTRGTTSEEAVDNAAGGVALAGGLGVMAGVPGAIVVEALAGIYFGFRVADECFGGASQYTVRGRSCQESGDVNTAITHASNSQCAASVLGLAGSAVGVGIAARTGRTVASILDEIPGPEIMRISNRYRLWLNRLDEADQDEAIAWIHYLRQQGRSDEAIERAISTCPIPR